MLMCTEDLLEELSKECSDPAAMLRRLVDERKIIRMKRGLYETDPLTPAYLDANAMHEPSYISFEYALARHGILHGEYMVVTSATTGLDDGSLAYSTPIGMFRYINIPPRAFPASIDALLVNGREVRIATPEKAVCDTLCLTRPVGSLDGIVNLMFVELGFDERRILEMDLDRISEISGLYRSRTVSTLARFLGATARNAHGPSRQEVRHHRLGGRKGGSQLLRR